MFLIEYFSLSTTTSCVETVSSSSMLSGRQFTSAGSFFAQKKVTIPTITANTPKITNAVRIPFVASNTANPATNALELIGAPIVAHPSAIPFLRGNQFAIKAGHAAVPNPDAKKQISIRSMVYNATDGTIPRSAYKIPVIISVTADIFFGFVLMTRRPNTNPPTKPMRPAGVATESNVLASQPCASANADGIRFIPSVVIAA